MEERRWPALVTVVPYVLLGVLAVGTVIIKHDEPRSLAIDLGLCALAALWMLGVFTLHPQWRDRTPHMLVFVAGLLVVIAILVHRDPWFGFFSPAAYFYAFGVLPWPWELPGVAAVAAVAGSAQASTVDKTTAAGLAIFVAVLLANILPMTGFAWINRQRDQRNDARKHALQDVSEANRKLEATLAENAKLHQQLLDQAREAGVQDERQRMAREIHDTLAQGLTGIITQLQAAENETADGDQQARNRHVGAAITLARESLNEARRSVHALRPGSLDSARLSDALADVAKRWTALHDIEVQVTTTGTTLPLPPDAELALLRTAQEALANVARHAQASRVGLTLSYLEDKIALDVRDDGKGFVAGEVDGEGGFGLIAMRQRIEALDGRLQIESEPGAGTAISASIPVLAGDR
ncbi:sensor histidine kinase [Kribbella koreensis]|uniref:Oxygen sensor histidine kinase NreB n=1 Tax=Kribbella koreensis TaxID=57909 RepID=A0ABN1RP25_9ACTN